MIKEFTGISDPYEAPKTPELRLDTEGNDVDYCAQQVILKLENMGLIRGSIAPVYGILNGRPLAGRPFRFARVAGGCYLVARAGEESDGKRFRERRCAPCTARATPSCWPTPGTPARRGCWPRSAPQAIGTTSAGFAFTLGLPDGARITRDQALAHAADLAAATPLPVSADLENGYAEAPDGVAETIRLAAEAGLAGASIEDTDLPGDGAYWLRPRRRAGARRRRRRPRPAPRLRARRPRRRPDDRRLRPRRGAAPASRPSPRPAPTASTPRCCPTSPRSAASAPRCAGPGERAGRPARSPPRPRADLADAGVARISLGSGLARVARARCVAAARVILDAGDFPSSAPAFRGGEVDGLLVRGAGDIVRD